MENVVSDCLTSELIFLTTNEGDVYQQELERRFKLLGLSTSCKLSLVAQEKQILTSLERSRDERWATHYFLAEGTKKETLPTPQQLCFSELVSIIDDANAAWARDHEWLSDEALSAVCQVMGDRENGNPYHNELLRRFKELSFLENQIGSFIRNECMIIERLKWSHHSNPAWQESTMIH